ncbi:MAG TPA: effector-associated domain EAD1-containing protein [Chloroflexia bacterium]|nr:effector-associated domain EAD1-containing protein [Chloroflexia bacterium]
MDFTGEPPQQLFDALLSAFPKKEALEQMVFLGLGENLATFASGNLRKMVLDLIQWAEAHGRLEDLIRVAHSNNPQNPKLAVFVTTHFPDFYASQLGAKAGQGVHRIKIPDDYYRKVIREFEELDIAGIRGEERIALKLSKVYVKLRVIPSEDEQGQNGSETREPGLLDIQTALRDYPQLVIVGDPGSGKSTFLKFIALMISRAKVENDSSLAETNLSLREPLPVPIFISLWELSEYIKRVGKTDKNTLTNYIRELFNDDFGVALSASNIQTMLRDGSCCILLDGLDEVPTESGRSLISDLAERFVDEYKNNRYVITSRVRGYTGGAVLRKGFRRCDIRNFDDDDIREFAQNWTSSLHKEGINAQREYETLMKAVLGNERVHMLAINPLLMTVIAIVYNNLKRLPERRVELYDECVKVLLGKRKENQGQGITTVEVFDPAADAEREWMRYWKRTRLAEIALSIMLQDAEEEITKQRILDILLKPFSDQPDSKTWDPQYRAERFLDEQESRSGLLVSRRSRSYRFVHLTFQEYLAAWALFKRNDYWSIVLPHLREPKWFETLQLLGDTFVQEGDAEELNTYIENLLQQMGDTITSRAPIVALCANIVRDTEDITQLNRRVRKSYEAALHSTLGAFRPEAKVPEKTQLEVLEALAGLGKVVKEHIISATKSQYWSVRNRAVELLAPYLSDNDLFRLTHILKDNSKVTIKTYLLTLQERNEERMLQLLDGVDKPAPKLLEAILDLQLVPRIQSVDTLLAWLQASYNDEACAIYLKELISRDEGKVRSALNGPRYWSMGIVGSVVSLSRMDLFDTEALFSMIYYCDYGPGIYHKRWYGVLLTELYRRDRSRALSLIEKSTQSDFRPKIGPKDITEMLTSDSNVLLPRWLNAAINARAVDLLERFTDESIIKAWQALPELYGKVSAYGPFSLRLDSQDQFFPSLRSQYYSHLDTNARRRFIGIAQSIIAQGMGDDKALTAVGEWLQWALEAKWGG